MLAANVAKSIKLDLLGVMPGILLGALAATWAQQGDLRAAMTTCLFLMGSVVFFLVAVRTALALWRRHHGRRT